LKKFDDFVKRNWSEGFWILSDILMLVFVWIFGSILTLKIGYSIMCLGFITVYTFYIFEREKQLKQNNKITKDEGKNG